MEDKKKAKSAPSSLLAQWKQKQQKTKKNGLQRRPEGVAAAASSGQQRLWLLQKLYPENPFYQYAHLFKIKGAVKADLLQQSFQYLIQRHEVLRSNYIEEFGKLKVIVHNENRFQIPEFDLSELSGAERKSELKRISRQEAIENFDLSQDELIRASLIKISDQEYHLLLSMHHIIGDRTSLEVLKAELWQSYVALSKAETPYLAQPTLQYADFAHWQQQKETAPAQFDYWLKQLAGELPFLALPADFPRPKHTNFAGATRSRKLPAPLSQKLQSLAKELACTPYVLFLSAFKILLFRYTGQTDILVGSPFSNRDQVALEKGIGFFNETLVLRSKLKARLSFHELVASVKKTTEEAFANKNVPFDELVSALQPKRRGSNNPLFQVMFLFNAQQKIKPANLDWEIAEEIVDLQVSKFDLTLFVNENPDHLSCSFEYATAIFSEETITRMLAQLEIILQAVADNPAFQLINIPLLSQAARWQILQDWNAPQAEFPKHQAIHELIEEMATVHPLQIAVADQERSISYAELNEQAIAVAFTLQQAGVKENTPVGLLVGRRVEMMIGILGILKAGAGYLPLDPTYPQERIEYMLQDAGASIVLLEEQWRENLNFSNQKIISFSEAAKNKPGKIWKAPKVKSEQLAYIIYTSGSTGRPKGVPIQHKQLLHSTQARFSFFPEAPSAFLLLSSFSFDSSVAGIFWTICTGGKLVIPPKRIEQDVQQLSDLIAIEQVSHTLLLPSLYSAILNHSPVEKLKSLRNVMVAGEACPFPLIQKHYSKLPAAALYNEYGPTEATVWCIAHLIRPGEKHFVPIGKAIPNTEVFILDQALQPTPIGVPGELYIGGPGLATGYWQRPALTAEKFLPHPFSKDSNQRIYKTGDLARFHVDGLIEFLGRVDQQIKIRGFRVELDEIQQVFLQVGKVEEAIIIVHKSGEQQRLVGYINELPEENRIALQTALRKQLPDYMIPNPIIELSTFPRLPNGKINRKALPAPDEFATQQTATFKAPQSEKEIALADIWQKVLKIKSIGVHDNFFSVGGDSILSIQLVAEAREKGFTIAPNQLFEHQTIAELAANITLDTTATKEVMHIENPTRFALSPLQQAFYFNSQQAGLDQGQLHLIFRLSGAIDFPKMKKAWQRCTERHDALRTYVSETAQEQVIADQAELPWTFEDWSHKAAAILKQDLLVLEAKEQEIKINLNQAPTSRFKLIKTADEQHVLCWTCHHLFLDGWSCGIVLKEALGYYAQSESSKDENKLPNYLAFLKWQQEQGRHKANNYWTNYLADFNRPLLFNKATGLTGQPNFKDQFGHFTLAKSQRLRSFCQANNITLVTLLQGLWSILLSRYFATNDITYGLTVSGRFAPFPNIAGASGLFMNVLPSRAIINDQDTLDQWLPALQKEQGQYDYIALEDIRSWMNWPGNIELFDTLFVFGNFLKDDLQIGEINVGQFTGGFTSNYPLTIRINPLENIEWQWRYNDQFISAEQMDWFEQSWRQLCQQIELKSKSDISSLRKTINSPAQSIALKSLSELSIAAQKNNSTNYFAPTTDNEKELCKIWEQLFNISNIGIKDNFFELGGKSILALQLFNTIEKELGISRAPALLFNYPTIEGLAKVLHGEEESAIVDSSLVALRSTGTRAPLFCLHGGGAHVFFYQEFAEQLPADQPVYSLQPRGLDGKQAFHQSIEDMAQDYIQVIKSVQPSGPYYLLGTCFSNAVALEIGQQLAAQNEELALLAIIDSGPLHLFGDDEMGSSKTLLRFWDMLKRGETKRVWQKINSRFLKGPQQKSAPKEETQAAKNLRLTIDSLNRLYANYHWPVFPGKIHFIRSSEFSQREDKKYHLTQWHKLAAGGLEVHVVKGHHVSLFDAPEVAGLAQKVMQCIQVESV